MHVHLRPAIAEFVGVFALMFVGGGAIIVSGGENILAIAFAHGLILACMVCATLHVSGGQFNPAVSIALSAIGKQPWTRTGVFVAAQFIGGILAAWILKFVAQDVWDWQTVSLGATLGQLSRGEHADIPQLLILEILATFLLMFSILGTAVDGRNPARGAMVAGFAIGLTVAANILFFGDATGASMNPARSFGPQLIGGYWDSWWTYHLAPVIGAILAALVWKFGIGLDRTD